MNNNQKRLYWVVISFLISVVFVFNGTGTAKADGIITDGQVPAGQTVENDAIAFGDQVTIDGSVDGDLIAFGGDVEINGDVTGSVITFGRDITLNGNVGGSVYSFGVNINLAPSSIIDRSLYFAGIRLLTEQGASVGRDMVGVSLTAQLAGQVGRDFKATIGLLQFIDIIREEVEEELEAQETPAPTQKPEEDLNEETGIDSLQPELAYISYTLLNQVENLSVQPAKLSFRNNPSPSAQIDTSGIQSDQIIEWIVDRVEAFVTYLIVGLIFMWIFPRYFNDWAEKIRTSPLSVSGYGLLGLIIALNGFVIFLVIAAILLAIGLGLGYITLWQLTFYFWGISYSSLVLAFFIFALFVFYVSKTIVAYLVGLLIVERFTQDPVKHRVLVFALGLLIYVLLAAIPYFGWAVGIIAIILGLGAVVLIFRETRKFVPVSKDVSE